MDLLVSTLSLRLTKNPSVSVFAQYHKTPKMVKARFLISLSPTQSIFTYDVKIILPTDTTAAINPESLKTLTTSTNYDIRNAAIKILVDRFLSIPSARSSLSADLDSSNPTTRDVARRTVKLLERHAGCYHSQHLQTLKRQAGLDRQDCSASHELLMRADWSDRFWSPSETRMRQREESPEEQALRRRRREAIVLNDSNRPVTQDDIIQRVDSGLRNTTRR